MQKNIHKNVQEQIKDALRSKDTVRAVTLRGVLAAFVTELKSGKQGGDELGDDAAVTIIKRLVKQRKDSIEQFQKGGRQDLADNEKAELEILEEFLPAQMSEDEVRKIVLRKKEEFGDIDKSKIGQFMGSVMKETAGNADGAMVKKIIEEIFQS